MEEVAAHLDMIFPDIDRRSPYIQCLVATYFSRANLIREILQQSETGSQPCDIRWTDTGIAMEEEVGRSKSDGKRKIHSQLEWIHAEFRGKQLLHEDRLVDSCGLESPFRVVAQEKVVVYKDSLSSHCDNVTELVQRVRAPDLEEIWRFCVNLRFACDQHKYPTVSNGFVNNPNYSFNRDGAYVRAVYDDIVQYLISVINSPYRMSGTTMGIDEIELMKEELEIWGQEVEGLRLNAP